MDGSRVRFWVALNTLKGIERVNAGMIIERFGGPEGVFSAAGDSFEGFPASFARSIRDFRDWDRIDKEIALALKGGARLVPYGAPEYPASLRLMHDPPCLLYMKGKKYPEEAPAVAVIGTRRPSHYGQQMAEVLGRELAAIGVNVVSGMARGCDTAAHKGALSSGGFTTAVLGTGVDLVYPAESKKLAAEIMEKGVLISEYPMSTPPQPYNFPRRNRIISGLSRGVVVVEAPLRSGSLMTARLALDYGRDVLAVPGQAMSARSCGTNKLIKDGAALVENAADVAGALAIELKAAAKKEEAAPAASVDEKALLSALRAGPAHIDSLLQKTGFTAQKASTILLEMELKGFVEQRPGKCFLRKV